MSRTKNEQAVVEAEAVTLPVVDVTPPLSINATPPTVGLIGRIAHLKRMVGIAGTWDGCTSELGRVVYVGEVQNENLNSFAGVVVEMRDGTLAAHPFAHITMRAGRQVSDV